MKMRMRGNKFMNTENEIYKEFNATQEEWTDWKWQVENSITSLDELKKYIPLEENEEKQIFRCLERLKMRITPYYLSLIDLNDDKDSIRLQAIPQVAELVEGDGESLDSLSEEEQSPVPGLVHRYPDRVLFLSTSQCYMYCRHCTRRHFVSACPQIDMKKQYDNCFEYIRNHPEIRDVVVSGGDPLTLPNETIEYILSNLRNIKHVQIIRIGSRVPVVLPYRVSDELCSILAKYHPVWLNTHFNNPKEITGEAIEACNKIVSHGIPMNNQSVLLAGVNDSVDTMKELVQKLMLARVRPYYLYECDMVEGLSHFRTPIAKGIEIIENLRGWTTGLAVPIFVVDTKGGKGKVPIQPDYIVKADAKSLVLRNYLNEKVEYTEPNMLIG